MEMKFDKLVQIVLEGLYEFASDEHDSKYPPYDKRKEQLAGEHANNWIVNKHKGGKVVTTMVGGKTFSSKEAASRYAKACNTGKYAKVGVYYSVAAN